MWKYCHRAISGKQLAEALYRGWIGDLSELTTWPKALRERLAAEGYKVGLPEIVQAFRSADGTERYLIAGNDARPSRRSGCRRATTEKPAMVRRRGLKNREPGRRSIIGLRSAFRARLAAR